MAVPSERSIAFFLAGLSGGGVARQTLALSAELARRGHRVTLLPASSGGVREQDVDPRVRLACLDRGPLARLASRGRTSKQKVLAALPALAGWLRREQPDALVSADHWPNFAAVIARALSGSGARLMLTQHVPLSVRARQKRSIGVLARALYPRADLLVAVSQGLACDLRERLPAARSRISTIYNPIVTSEFPARMAAAPTHPWLRDDGPPVLMSIGRLTRQKDFPTLLRAFARLRREREVRLVVYGTGALQSSLNALASELDVDSAVDFAGFISDPLPELSRAAVFVLASQWEGFGNVLVEALACGCPVVSTDCPSGPAEILDGGRFGALVPVGDAEALEAALGRALDARCDAQPLRQRAAEFSVERSADAYLNTLLGAVHQRQPARAATAEMEPPPHMSGESR